MLTSSNVLAGPLEGIPCNGNFDGDLDVDGEDVTEFLNIASEAQIKPEIQTYPLEDANKALIELKERKIKGAKVLTIN